MTPWNSIPAEILTRIFQCIANTSQQLGEYRLVGKSWDYPAESAMFSKEVRLKNSDKLQRLYDHLKKKPARGKLVKHLNLDFAYTDMPRAILEHFFELCFTPNLEVLEGEMLSADRDVVYEIITKIVQRSNEKFNKLKYLANSRFVTEMYLETLSLFKESLERMDLQFTDNSLLLGEYDSSALAPDFALELDDFKKLSNLDLQMHYDYSLQDMDYLLNNCLHLQHLRVSVSSHQYDSLQDSFDIDKINKLDGLKTLILYSDPGELPVLLEYCLLKLRTIEKIVYESPDGPPGFADNDMGDFLRELEMLKSMPYYEMEFSIDEDVSLDDIHNVIKSEKNDVAIDMLDRIFPGQQTREVSVKVTLI